MSYTTVGHCPHCGAPIYAESPYFSILPPPNIYTCSCVKQPETIFATTTQIIAKEEHNATDR